MEGVIRLATERDIAGVALLFTSGHGTHAAALPALFRVTPDAFSSPEYQAGMTKLIGADNDALFVAEREGQIIGTIRVSLREAPEDRFVQAERIGVITNLAVLDAHAGHGVGRALIEAAEQWARGKGLSAVELDVFEFNQGAIAIYEHLGFATLRRTMRKAL